MLCGRRAPKMVFFGTPWIIILHYKNMHNFESNDYNSWMQREHILFGKIFTLSDSVGDVLWRTGTEIGIFRDSMGNHFTLEKYRNFSKQ